MSYSNSATSRSYKMTNCAASIYEKDIKSYNGFFLKIWCDIRNRHPQKHIKRLLAWPWSTKFFFRYYGGHIVSAILKIFGENIFMPFLIIIFSKGILKVIFERQFLGITKKKENKVAQSMLKFSWLQLAILNFWLIILKIWPQNQKKQKISLNNMFFPTRLMWL